MDVRRDSWNLLWMRQWHFLSKKARTYLVTFAAGAPTVVVTYLMVSPCGPLRLHSAPVRHANIILRFSPPTIIFRSHESSEAKNLLSTNFFAFSYLFHLSFILHLIFMVPCIMITFFKMTNKMQMCWIIYCSLTALHVSSDVFAHH